MLSTCNGRISRLDFSYVPQWVCWEKSSPETMVFTMKKHWFLPKKWGFPVMFPYRTIEFPLTSARRFPTTRQPWQTWPRSNGFPKSPGEVSKDFVDFMDFITGWWFQSLWKTMEFVRLDHHPNYSAKKMFQTTNQISFDLSPHEYHKLIEICRKRSRCQSVW